MEFEEACLKHSAHGLPCSKQCQNLPPGVNNRKRPVVIVAGCMSKGANDSDFAAPGEEIVGARSTETKGTDVKIGWERVDVKAQDEIRKTL